MSNRRRPKQSATSTDEPWPDPPELAQWRATLRRERHGHHGFNAYKCPDCQKVTVTRDVDPGATPAFLGCRRTEGCKGTAVSAGYPEEPLPTVLLNVHQWEWRRATIEEHRTAAPAMRQHIERGGLVLAPYSGRPSAYTLSSV